MEDKTFMMPFGKSILRSTGEEVEIIDSEIKERGARTDEDWVTYIDSKGEEHIKEHLNIQLDFKSKSNDTFEKILNFTNFNKNPSERNRRLFEVAKSLVREGESVDRAINTATELVDKIGIEIE